MSTKADIPPPTVSPCMLFCDGVIVERGTLKMTLIGTHSGVAAHSYPSPPRDLHVYVELSSFVGDVAVRLRCERIDQAETEEVHSTTHKAHFRGKLVVEQLHIVWPLFQFPAAGKYVFQLWCQDQCVAERRLSARIKGGSNEP